MSMNSFLPFLKEKSAQKFLEKYPFLGFPETQKWLNELNVHTHGKHGFSDENFRQVINRLHRYLLHSNLSPKQLIDEVEADLNLPLRQRTNPAANRLTAYLRTLPMASKTTTAHIQTLKGFYKHNGFKVEMYVPKGENTKEKVALTKELIKQCVILAPHLREKVILLIMASSGMSITDVLDLEYRHIQGEFEAGTTPLLVHFTRTKNNNGYKTFVSTECVQLLREYLRDRPMFPGEKLFDVSYKSFSGVLRGISQKVLHSNHINSKSFRRFFNTAMKMAGVNDTIVEYWMGHTIPTKEDYLDPEKLRATYTAKEDEVTILTTVIIQKAEAIKKEVTQEYEARIAAMEQKIERLLTCIHDQNVKESNTDGDPFA